MIDTHTSLRRDLWRGRIWYGLEQFIFRGVGLLVSIILARLLQPDEFGLIASIAIMLMMAQHIIDGGIADRIIQKKEATQEDFNALYWSNLVISLFACGILFSSAHPISNFYSEPRLVPVVRVMAGVLFLLKAGRVHYCILMRGLRFHVQSIILIISCLVSGLAAVWAAFQGWGYWAILVQQVTLALVRTSLYWSVVSWRPGAPPPWSAIADIYSFGAPILISQTIRGMAEQLIAVLGGRFYGMTALGFYDRGRFIPGHAEQFSICVFGRTNLAVLSKMQHDDEGFVRVYSENMNTLLSICWMGFALLYICIGDLVVVAFGQTWVDSIPFARLGCALGALHLLFLMQQDVLKSKAAIRALFTQNINYAVAYVIGILAGSQWGFTGMLTGTIVASGLSCLLQARSIIKHSPLSLKIMSRVIFVPLLLSVILLLLIMPFASIGSTAWQRLLICGIPGICIGLAGYYVSNKLLTRSFILVS